MNIQREEEALRKLPPQKYTIRILIIAVCALFAAIPAVWKERMGVVESLDSQLQQCREEKVQMAEQRRKDEQVYERARLERAEADKRRSDSVLFTVMAAQRAVKQAINEQKKK